MRTFIFTFLLIIPVLSFANETQCTFIEGNTYWKESIDKCRSNCVFNYKHQISVFFDEKQNLGSSRGSNDSSDFELTQKKFDDYKIKGDYYILYKGQKMNEGIFEVCAMKKSDSYTKKKQQLDSEEKLKKDLKSIPNFFKDLLIGGFI